MHTYLLCFVLFCIQAFNLLIVLSGLGNIDNHIIHMAFYTKYFALPYSIDVVSSLIQSYDCPSAREESWRIWVKRWPTNHNKI